MKRSIELTLRIVISASLIALLLYMMRGNYGKLLGVFARMDIALFALSVAVFFLSQLIIALRLGMIVRAQEYRLPFLEAAGLTFIGYFFNNFLPTSIGGDVVKAYYLTKKTQNATASFASIFMDRFLGLFTMILIAGLALFMVSGTILDVMTARLLYLVLALACVAFVFIFHRPFASKFSFLLKLVKPIEEKLKRLYKTIHNYQTHKGVMLQTLALSFISQFVFFFSVFVLAASIGVDVPLREIFLGIPIVCALTLIPTINGIGVREGSMVLLFGALIGKENAFALGVLSFGTLLCASIAGGIVYALSPQFRMSKLPSSVTA